MPTRVGLRQNVAKNGNWSRRKSPRPITSGGAVTWAIKAVSVVDWIRCAVSHAGVIVADLEHFPLESMHS